MEDKIILMLVNWWPVTVFIVLAYLAPMAITFANWVCHWLDDGEESFKYPKINILPWIVAKDVVDPESDAEDYERRLKFDRGHWVKWSKDRYVKDGELYIKTKFKLGSYLGGTLFLLGALSLVHWFDRFIYPPLTEVVLASVAFAWVSRKILRIGKALAKHIKDPDAHKETED